MNSPATSKTDGTGLQTLSLSGLRFNANLGVQRYFCGQCGSPILSKRDAQPEVVRVRMGTLDTPVAAGPGAHIFVGSKAEWDVIRDDLPQHQERPPA